MDVLDNIGDIYFIVKNSKVIEGIIVVEKIPTDDKDKPLSMLKIISTFVFANPFKEVSSVSYFYCTFSNKLLKVGSK